MGLLATRQRRADVGDDPPYVAERVAHAGVAVTMRRRFWLQNVGGASCQRAGEPRVAIVDVGVQAGGHRTEGSSRFGEHDDAVSDIHFGVPDGPIGSVSGGSPGRGLKDILQERYQGYDAIHNEIWRQCVEAERILLAGHNTWGSGVPSIEMPGTRPLRMVCTLVAAHEADYASEDVTLGGVWEVHLLDIAAIGRS